MRKWQDLAAPDDPGSWNAVTGMWPTIRGTYEMADISSGSSVTGPGLTSDLAYAFAFGISSGAVQEYVGMLQSGAFKVYSWDGTTLTQRSSFAAISLPRGLVSMARFGGTALLACGFGGQAVQRAASFGSNFADIAGAPTGKSMICVQSNIAAVFSHLDANWATSDAGDPTNWSTGEASSGTISTFPGNVTAAREFGNDIMVFKPGSIHRMTYVGGSTIKWQIQLAWAGIGVPDRTYLADTLQSTQDWAIATNHGVAFYGGNGYVYLFDGASPPRCLNPLTTIDVEGNRGIFTYDPAQDVLCIAPSRGSSATGTALVDGSSSTTTSVYYYYHFTEDAWGQGFGSSSELQATSGQAHASGVVRGPYYFRNSTSSKPTFWVAVDVVSGTIRRCAPASPTSSAVGSLQTMKIGASDLKTQFDRLTTVGRRRTDLGSGSASLSFELFRELEDTSAQSTRTVTEATARKRFELAGGSNVDCFGRFKITWTGLDVEVDDFKVKTTPAGSA